jgi:hypothetical protein
VRCYRVVKLTEDSRALWLVVSSSMRDDDTWDVIYRAESRHDAFRYVDDVLERNRMLERAGYG